MFFKPKPNNFFILNCKRSQTKITPQLQNKNKIRFIYFLIGALQLVLENHINFELVYICSFQKKILLNVTCVHIYSFKI